MFAATKGVAVPPLKNSIPMLGINALKAKPIDSAPSFPKNVDDVTSSQTD